MIVVNTYIKDIPGKGIGLFAGEFLKKDTVWWIWKDGFDVKVSPKTFNNLNKITQDYVLRYCVKGEDGTYYICTDNGKYNNHSLDANTDGEDYSNGVAMVSIVTRDVQKDEELTCNYLSFIYDYPNGKLDFNVI